MTVADYAETPFARLPRLHHKDAAEGPSSAPFGRRNLVGMMGVMMASTEALPPWDYEVKYIQCNISFGINTGINTSSANGMIRIVSNVGALSNGGRYFYWGYDPSYNTYFEYNNGKLGTNPNLIDASEYVHDSLVGVDWLQTSEGITTKINLGGVVHELVNTSYKGMPTGKDIYLFKLGNSYGTGAYNRLGRTDIFMSGKKVASLVPCVYGGELSFYDTKRLVNIPCGNGYIAGPRV